ncbi:MAG: S41 family peptidase [Dehalococcoidia bacterium]
MKIKRSLLFSLLVVLLLILSFGAGFGFSQVLSPGVPQEFNTLWEVWRFLSQDYVNKEAIDPEELSQGAIEGLLEALGDPYTHYLDVETYELTLSDLEGSFEGIGAFVTMEDGEFTVVSPLAGTPAEEAGIRAGDRILEIDGETTSGMTLTEAVLKIRGPQGTMVTLLVLHQGEADPVVIEIIRERIDLDSVYLEMLPDNIAHIQITYFSQYTSGELSAILNDALSDGAVGIVLDLRGNPGGYLHIVVDVASQFLSSGVVLYEEDSEGNLQAWNVKPGGLATDLPLAVLVDGGSASASEVLAGALQDRERAPLIGTTTYGKGSVQVIHKLSDGSALYMTTARWLTANGRQIEGEGLAPDFVVEITEEDIEGGRDPQLEFAIEYIKAQL